MPRIAPFAQQQVAMFHTLNTQQRIMDLQVQLATGKKSQAYQGVASNSSRLISMETGQASAQQFLTNIEIHQQRVSIMDLSLDTIEDAVRDARDVIEGAISAPETHVGSLKPFIANIRDLVRDMLNVRDGGRYLFGGDVIQSKPVDFSAPGYTNVSLIESDGVTVDETFYQAVYEQVQGNTLPFAQGSFYAQLYFDKNGVAPTVPLPADLNNPTVTEINGEDPGLFQFYVDQLNNAAMLATSKIDYYQGDTAAVTARADADVTISYSVNAGELALQQILSALDAVANLGDGDPRDAYDQAVLQKARAMLSVALGSEPSNTVRSINEMRSELGAAAEGMDRVRARHDNFIAYAAGVIGDIENIDSAEVVTRMNSDAVALEAAFSAVSRLQSLSLINFL